MHLLHSIFTFCFNLIYLALACHTFNISQLAYGIQVPDRFELSLYTGVKDLVHLDQSYNEITRNKIIPFTTIDTSNSQELRIAGLTSGLTFDTIGTIIYFKNTVSKLIVLTPPFKGLIGKRIPIFDSTKPAQITWEEFITKEFGLPSAKKEIGGFDGDIFFYEWGDIEFNKSGFRKLHLYTDKSIKKYRELTKPKSTSLF